VRTVAAVLLLLGAAPPLAAQQSTAAGRVVVPRATDTVALPRARVLLHRVGRDAQGPIDSVVADAAGRFRFRFRADTSALYLLSTRYGGIEYFSPPVHTNPALPDTAMRVVAYDTSSTVPVAVEARHIVVPRAGADGSRDVLDLVVLRNDGIAARIAPDSAHPSWAMRLPAGAGAMQVGESELSPDAVVRAGDTVKVLAPIAPGEKQLSIEYATQPSGGRIAFPVGPADEPINLLVEDRDARVSGGTLALADTAPSAGSPARCRRAPRSRSSSARAPPRARGRCSRRWSEWWRWRSCSRRPGCSDGRAPRRPAPSGCRARRWTGCSMPWRRSTPATPAAKGRRRRRNGSDTPPSARRSSWSLSAPLRPAEPVPTFDRVRQPYYANGDARKPVQYRCGPATVTGTTSRRSILAHDATG
jgi:hypothetical protein